MYQCTFVVRFETGLDPVQDWAEEGCRGERRIGINGDGDEGSC